MAITSESLTLGGYEGLAAAIVRDATAEVQHGQGRWRPRARCQQEQLQDCTLCAHSANCFLLGLWSWWSRCLLDLAGVDPAVFRRRLREQGRN